MASSFMRGLIAAPFTPLTAHGDLALSVVPKLAARLRRNGVRGAFVCGTTGEGPSLTSDERKRVAEAWTAERRENLEVIVHVGTLSLGESRELARHAEQVGAQAIATVAPSFFKPAAKELVAWCREVAAAAPALPFYYYHMPSMTGVSVSAAEFLREAGISIPTLAGVKFTHEDLVDYEETKNLAGQERTVFFGRDEILLSALALGAPGAVGSTYNYAAPLYLRLVQAFEAGLREKALADQEKAAALVAIMNRFGGVAGGKAIMKLSGIDCGPARLPLRTILSAEEADLKAELDRIGFFEFASRD